MQEHTRTRTLQESQYTALMFGKKRKEHAAAITFIFIYNAVVYHYRSRVDSPMNSTTLCSVSCNLTL